MIQIDEVNKKMDVSFMYENTKLVYESMFYIVDAPTMLNIVVRS